MRTRRIDLATGVTLAVAEEGDGGRPLLLVHGYGGAKEDFTDFLDDLAARGWHALAPDLRGHGESDWPDREDDYSFEVFAADLVALADALGWGPAVVLGHSMGGMVVQRMALDHPHRVAALVFMDTAHGPMDWIDPQLVELGTGVVREQGVAAKVELERQLEDPLSTPAYQRLLAERAGYEEFCRRKSLSTAAAMHLAMMPVFIAQADRLEQLATLARPTLVVAGEQDKGFVEHCERMAKMIPGARHVVIADAGHSPQFEATDAWWAALTGFLDSLEARS